MNSLEKSMQEYNNCLNNLESKMNDLKKAIIEDWSKNNFNLKEGDELYVNLENKKRRIKLTSLYVGIDTSGNAITKEDFYVMATGTLFSLDEKKLLKRKQISLSSSEVNKKIIIK